MASREKRRQTNGVHMSDINERIEELNKLILAAQSSGNYQLERLLRQAMLDFEQEYQEPETEVIQSSAEPEKRQGDKTSIRSYLRIIARAVTFGVVCLALYLLHSYASISQLEYSLSNESLSYGPAFVVGLVGLGCIAVAVFFFVG